MQESVLNNLNCHIHQQIRKYLAADAAKPYRFDKLDVNNVISELDPTLWCMIASLTKTVSEQRHSKGK